MAMSAQRELWNHTSNILALIFNVNRDSKKTRAVTASELHPLDRFNHEVLTAEQEHQKLKDQFATLRERAFVGKVKTIKASVPVNSPSG